LIIATISCAILAILMFFTVVSYQSVFLKSSISWVSNNLEPTPFRDRAPNYFAVFFLVLGAVIGAAFVWMWSKQSSRRWEQNAPEPKSAASNEAAPIADMGHHVFVSYSHRDGPTVEQLVKDIERAGYTVWIDRQSPMSRRYAAPIVRAIKASRVVALMCSENSFASDHVIREVYVAGDYKKPFIAFQLDHSDFPEEVLYFVTGFPRVPVEELDSQQLRSELARLVAA